MWSVSYDHAFIGAVIIVLGGYRVAPLVLGINAASYLEARKLARHGLDRKRHVDRRRRLRRNRRRSQRPRAHVTTVIRKRGLAHRREGNLQ